MRYPTYINGISKKYAIGVDRGDRLDFDLHARRGKIPILDTSPTATVTGYQANPATKAPMANLCGGLQELVSQVDLTGNSYDDATPPGPSLAVSRFELRPVCAYVTLHDVDVPYRLQDRL